MKDKEQILIINQIDDMRKKDEILKSQTFHVIAFFV
jgi:hypothetical protein